MENGLLGFSSINSRENNKTFIDFIGYTEGMYIGPPMNQGFNFLETAQRTAFAPIYIYKKTSFNRIGTFTGTNFSGTAVIRLGIYNSGPEFQPTTVVLDAGTMTITVANVWYESAIDLTLDKGWYWMAFNTVTAATTHSFRRSNNNMCLDNFSRYNDSVNTPVNCLFQDSVTGNFTPVNSLLSDTPGAPLMVLRVSS